MKRSMLAVLTVVFAAACGSQWNLPFSQSPLPALPSNISVGPSEGHRGDPKAIPSPSADAQDITPVGVPRNEGTRVWFVPVPGGDMLRLAREPQLWEKARARIDVFSFYILQGYHQPDWECGLPCGPNTYQATMDVVPGGMFKWMYDQGIQLSVDAAAVKSHACTPERVRGEGQFTATVIRNMESTGARVSFVHLDEPFFSGTNPLDYPGFGGCALSTGQTAELLKLYMDEVHAKYPSVQIGLIEPYPAMKADAIMSAVLELEHLGVRLPFLHIDMQSGYAVATKKPLVDDLRRMREFCAARGIPFGVIIFGFDGRSNEAFATGAWAQLRQFNTAVGVTDDTVFQSWAETEPGNLNSAKIYPETVPESDPAAHSGQINSQLEYLRVQPAK